MRALLPIGLLFCVNLQGLVEWVWTYYVILANAGIHGRPQADIYAERSVVRNPGFPSAREWHEETMILSDRDLKKALEEGKIKVDPLFPNSMQPASIDVHLGADFLIFRNEQYTCIDPKEPIDVMM